MKSSRRQSTNVIDMAPLDGAGTSASTARVSEEQIAQRAFELYSARGYQDGHDVDDWFQAERDLRGHGTSSAR
jgi:hypothetical protein